MSFSFVNIKIIFVTNTLSKGTRYKYLHDNLHVCTVHQQYQSTFYYSN
jgi:hypothetical protein